MTKRTTPLLRALVEMSEVHSSEFVRGNPNRAYISPFHRPLSTSLALPARQPILPPSSPFLQITPSRSFIDLAASIAGRRMQFSESRSLGYTPEQMYSVVASVDQYQHFVPWCKKSRVVKGRGGDVQAQLEIGFPPVVERYTSEVTVVPNHQVRAVCLDGSLFNHLEVVWRFFPVLKDQPASCNIDFYVSFEFKFLLHSRLASVFIDEAVKQMVNAFESRAAELYGSPHTSCQVPAWRRAA
ncbi:coenzyme Q-binding protein COQ10 homolog, mitochondrial [Esox lucius]|uniref:coenzyme Q-binding protein COQ10 homolog, mitochondrial n=1 Tax=Esox lucius TaxID=8010 RepID=UPI00057808A1|nr:coenzyme Q-binding protein COQ10 homolog, mitochondrial [Esox lucius]